MMGFKVILTLLGVLVIQFVFADGSLERGQKLYEANCVACHGATGGMDMSKRLAPPIIAVKMHYKKKLKDKESFVAAVSAWVVNPNKDKSLMKGAIRKFNLMPPLALPTEDIEQIAKYMYEGKLKRPEGFDEHVKKMHGGKGKKGGCGGKKH